MSIPLPLRRRRKKKTEKKKRHRKPRPGTIVISHYAQERTVPLLAVNGSHLCIRYRGETVQFRGHWRRHGERTFYPTGSEAGQFIAQQILMSRTR